MPLVVSARPTSPLLDLWLMVWAILAVDPIGTPNPRSSELCSSVGPTKTPILLRVVRAGVWCAIVSLVGTIFSEQNRSGGYNRYQ